MTIQLAPEDEALVARMLTTGQFPNTADVIHEALIALEEREKIRRFREAVEEGEEDFARGDIYPWTPGFLDQIRAEANELFLAGATPDADVCP